MGGSRSVWIEGSAQLGSIVRVLAAPSRASEQRQQQSSAGTSPAPLDQGQSKTRTERKQHQERITQATPEQQQKQRQPRQSKAQSRTRTEREQDQSRITRAALEQRQKSASRAIAEPEQIKYKQTEKTTKKAMPKQNRGTAGENPAALRERQNNAQNT